MPKNTNKTKKLGKILAWKQIPRLGNIKLF